MRATIRVPRSCLAILLLSPGACQSPTARSCTGPQPATSAPVSEHVEPGIYKFKAIVKSVRITEPDTEHRIIQGVATICGERCIFTGRDVNWAIQLDVQEVEKPLWFLKTGEPVTIVVHSPVHVFGKGGSEAVGETWQFSLTITRQNDGSLDFGPLTTPNGVFAKKGGFRPRQ